MYLVQPAQLEPSVLSTNSCLHSKNQFGKRKYGFDVIPQYRASFCFPPSGKKSQKKALLIVQKKLHCEHKIVNSCAKLLLVNH